MICGRAVYCVWHHACSGRASIHWTAAERRSCGELGVKSENNTQKWFVGAAGDYLPHGCFLKQLVLALLWVHKLGQRVGVNGLEVLGRRRLAQRIAQRVKQVDGHVDLQACGVRAAANTWEVRTPWTEDRR